MKKKVKALPDISGFSLFFFVVSSVAQKKSSIFLLLLVTLALLLRGLVLLVVLVEAASGHLVQAEDGLVGVLDEDVLAVLLALEAHVGDGADDTPTVGEGQVHLVSEVAGLPADDAEDDVLVVGLGVGAGHETV